MIVKDNYDLIASIYDYDMALNMPYQDVDFYLARVAGKKSVLEIGCGTGRITIPMAKLGIDMCGIDASVPMLLRCKQKIAAEGNNSSAIQLIAMDARYLSVNKKFDYIFFAFSGVNYLHELQDVQHFLRSLPPLLSSGGRVLLDAFVPRQQTSATGWTLDYVRQLPNGNRLKRQKKIVSRESANFIHRKYEELHSDGTPLNTIETSSVIKPYAPQDLRDLLRACGFTICQEWWDYGQREQSPADFFSVEARFTG